MAYTVKVHGESYTVDTTAQAWDRIRQVCDQKGYDPALKIEEIKPAPALTIVRQPVTTQAGTVDAEGAARAKADEKAALEAGFAVAQPLYATGTRVNDTGVANARRFRAEWEALPPIRDALSALADTVRGERRVDRKISPHELRMDTEGRVVFPNGERLAFERDGFDRFASLAGLPRGAASYLSECLPDLRARNVNQWLSGQQGQLNRDGITLRTREGESGRAIYAVVSTKYNACDTDVLARELAKTLPDTGRGNVFYDGTSLQIDALWHSTTQPEKYVAGEIFRAGLRLRSNDAGGGSISGSSMVERNLCLNLIILDVAKQGLFRYAHKGAADLVYAVRKGMTRGAESLRYFIHKWDAARSEILTEPGAVTNMEGAGKPVPTTLTDLMWGIFVANAERELVPVVKRDTREVLRAWQVEPEATRAGVANAYTRYAQSLPPFEAAEVERGAGEILRGAPLQWLSPV